MKRSEQIFWSIGAVLALLVLGALWIASIIVSDDKGKAALIGAASALTVAIFTFAGGFLTTFRTQMLAARMALTSERRQSYGRLLSVAARYEDVLVVQRYAGKERDAAKAVLDQIEAREPRGTVGKATEVELEQQSKEAHRRLEEASNTLDEAITSTGDTLNTLMDAAAVAELLATTDTAKAIGKYVREVRRDEGSAADARTLLISAIKLELRI